MDLSGRLKATNVRPARSAGDFGNWLSNPLQCAVQYLGPNQKKLHPSAAFLRPHNWNRSTSHHLKAETPAAKGDLSLVVFDHQRNRFRSLEPECHIVRGHCLQRPQHDHHCAEGLYEMNLQKPECMKFPPPIGECCTVHPHLIHKPLHDRHYGGTLYVFLLQLSECMRLLAPRLEPVLVHANYFQEH